MEAVIRDALMSYFTDHQLMHCAQHGFRPKRSCMTQLLTVMEDWTEMFEKGDPFDALYLDFSKAFDSVPHQRLLSKLRSYGVSGQLLKWIADFLMER